MASWFIWVSTIIGAISLVLRFYQFSLDTEDESFTNLRLPPSTISEILSFHTSNTQNIKSSPRNEKIAFGYAGDLDIVVNAMDLIKSLDKKSSPNPKYHQSLANLADFFEALAHFFKEGSGIEYFLENPDDFRILVENSLPLAKIKEIGGNGAVMAMRAFQEGIDILLGCSLDEKSYEEHFGGKAKLVSPLMKNMTDIHLVLDYFEDEQWGDLRCPRSNRFYLNHDIINTELQLLDAFHSSIKDFKPNIIAIGGLHLFNDFPEEKIYRVFRNIRNHLIIDKEHSKIHLEMGSFSNEVIVHSLVQNLFPHIQSIGLNEQELSFLLDYFLFYGKEKVQYGANSKSSINQLLEKLVAFLSFIKNRELPLERVQFHSLNLHTICYKKEFWEDPYIALKKTILVALQTCKHENSHIPLDDFDFNADDMEITLSSQLELLSFEDATPITHTFDSKKPYSCWDLDSEWECCYAITPNWISPKRTRGLGDNISSSGLIYHKTKK